MDIERIALAYAPDGVLMFLPSCVSDAEIVSYLKRRNVHGSDPSLARKQAAQGIFPVRIAPQQDEGPPAPDEASIVFSRDDMTASLLLFPGDEEGEWLTYDALSALLTDTHKIVCGIHEEALLWIAQMRPYREAIEVAHGIPPVDGLPGKLDFHFRLSSTKRPKLLDGDRVDYRTLDLFVPVRTDDVLVTRTPPVPGVDGQTLRGRTLRARPGKDVRLPVGKGVAISDDKCAMTAMTDGMVTYQNGAVAVASRYVVQGNVDMSVGNIDFPGDIEVRGNVIAGMTLKAEGNLEVHGIVEAAFLTAGGDVLLHQGMQGVGRGSVRAGGDVTAKYFERVHVSAGGMISADAIYHSDCNAVEGVNLAGKHASLIGGTTRSLHMVSARTVGSVAHVATVIEMGLLPGQRERLIFLKNEQLRLANEREKLELLIKSFGGAPKANEPPERAALRARIIDANRQNLVQMSQATTERNEIEAEIKVASSGRVHVLGTIFDGAKIVIGPLVYHVESPIEYATFRVVDKELGFTACELRE